MQVKVHPHKTMVNAGIEACISVTPIKKHGRAHYSGTVIMRDVNFKVNKSGVERAQREGQRNVHAWAVGELVGEFENQFTLDTLEIPKAVKDKLRNVTYHYQEGEFKDLKTGKVVESSPAVFAVGRDFFYLPR